MNARAVIRVTYRIETSGSVEKLAAKIASDQSTGTFVALPGETEALRARAAARVVKLTTIEPALAASFPASGSGPFNRGEAVIEFPLDAVGADLAAVMTVAIGGVYSIKGLTGIRITGLELPDEFRERYPGPAFGTPGSFALTQVKDRPIIGSIIKPALGLTLDETAGMTRQLIEAGIDFIKDDEKLMSPAYSPLAARVKAVMPVIRDHEQRTGKKVMYAWGISAADPDEMLSNHDCVLEAGGNCAVININSIGLGAMLFLRKRSGIVLHAHRNGWDILTRHPGLGLDFSVYQQFWRLAGVDQFQINGIGAKYWEPDESFVASFKSVTTPIFSAADCALPVVCSGQWGGQAPETFARTGGSLDLMYLCGGGILSHPGGLGAGVRAVRQAWEAAAARIPLADYARAHRELAQSLEKFGGGAGDA